MSKKGEGGHLKSKKFHCKFTQVNVYKWKKRNEISKSKGGGGQGNLNFFRILNETDVTLGQGYPCAPQISSYLAPTPAPKFLKIFLPSYATTHSYQGFPPRLPLPTQVRNWWHSSFLNLEPQSLSCRKRNNSTYIKSQKLWKCFWIICSMNGWMDYFKLKSFSGPSVWQRSKDRWVNVKQATQSVANTNQIISKLEI